MNNTNKTEKYSADKIALLGLFAVSLLIARFIVSAKSAITLTEPIRLNYTGLSVPMPLGNGWESKKKWQFNENSFILDSFFRPASKRTAAQVTCRYLLASTGTAPDILFEQRASAADGSITETGKTQCNTITFDWAHIESQRAFSGAIAGIAELPGGRRLYIEVAQAIGERELAESVFKKILSGLKFEDNQLLKAGTEVITQVKNTGLGHFLYERDRQSFFIIKDASDRSVGFTMDVLIDSEQNDNLNIQAGGFFYFKGRFMQERATFFQSDNSFDRFNWKSEFNDRGRRSGNEIALSEDGIMTVKTLGLRTMERKYHTNPAAIPYVLLETIFSRMLTNGYKEIIVDVIKTDGRIAPALISSVEADSTREQKAVYILKIEQLDQPGFFEQVYLDKEMQVVEKIIKQQSVYALEKSNLQDILQKFPERADFISQRNKMMNHNRL